MNANFEIIASATGAGNILIPVLERIMREDIFHGTLDWQTREELATAAQQALRIYESEKLFFDADTAFRKARWNRILAEREAKEYPESEAHQNALATALEFENSAIELLNRCSNTMA